MSSHLSESDSLRHNLELWLVGEEKLDVHAMYEELHQRYPDALTPTNYAAHLLAAVMGYEQVVPPAPHGHLWRGDLDDEVWHCKCGATSRDGKVTEPDAS